MDPAVLSALSALAGSIVGGLSSFLTTWATQRSQSRNAALAQDRARREALYGDFIDEASRLFADALHHELEDVGQMVRLYSLVSRMRLFSTPEIVSAADQVMTDITAAYIAPNLTVRDLGPRTTDTADPLRAFSEAARLDLGGLAPLRRVFRR